MEQKTDPDFERKKARAFLYHSSKSIKTWFADPVPGFVLSIKSENGLTVAYVERLSDPSLGREEIKKDDCMVSKR
jgi:hypothetical protein